MLPTNPNPFLLTSLVGCFLLGEALAGASSEFHSNDILTSSFDSKFGPWRASKLLLNLDNVNFGAKWRIDAVTEGDDSRNSYLTLLLAANTLGWLGFGIGESSSGSMLGADIVITSVDPITGETEVSDRYVPWVSYPMTEGSPPLPLPDEQQDWWALDAVQTDNGTAVVLRRKLDTGDTVNDRLIDPAALTPILFAYGEESSALGYHGNRRGVDSIRFDPSFQENDERAPVDDAPTPIFDIPADADSYVDAKMPDILLPQGQTDMFGHFSIDLGDLDDVVGVDFDAASSSPHFMHHLTVYACDSANDDWKRWVEAYETYDVSLAITSCPILFGWALGGTAEFFPENVAMRGIRHVILQGHYNMPKNGTDENGNPTHAGAGTPDASGIRLYTTSTRRKYEAKSMLLHYVEDGTMPALQDEVHYEAACSSECTKPFTRPLTIMLSFLHMHSYGKQIWASLYDSNGNYKEIISRTDFWNFQFQKTVTAHAIVEPGDEIRLHCVFDTSNSDEPITWGEQSNQEMCSAFLWYYVQLEDDELEDGTSDQYDLSYCGGVRFPWLGMEHGMSFCNNDAVLTGTELESNAEPLSCNAGGKGTFPLRIDFGNDNIEDDANNATDSGCSDTRDAASTATIVLLGLLALCLLMIGYTDFWMPLLLTSSKSLSAGGHASHENSSTAASSENLDSSEPTAAETEAANAAADAAGNALVTAAVEFAKNNPFEARLLMESFRQHVKDDPDRLQFGWLDANADMVKSFTRKELWDQSRDLAFYLQKQYDLKPGQRAMIVYPPGIDFLVGFVALLRLGVVIVSVYPPNPESFETSIPQFANFVEDSGATVALTTSMYNRVVQGSKMRFKNWPSNLKWVSTDKKRPAAPEGWKEHVSLADNVALLQYTSGSTSQPKGVAITEKNLMIQCSIIHRCYHVYGGTTMEQSQDAIGVSWTPAYHDMGLIGGFLCHLASGSRAYNLSPITFLRDPLVWVKAMQKYRATCTNGPNFGFALTCKRLEALKKKNGLEKMPRIPSLQFAVLGAEPSDIRLLDRIDQVMGIDRKAVASMYGLAEHTLAATSGSSQKLYPDNRWSVGNLQFSKAICDVTVLIVDPDTLQKVQDGTPGEIWISGPCVAAGYWGKTESASSTFRARCAGDSTAEYLRTGDLGVVREGQLFAVSRLKDLIIVNGKNIAPTDVEYAVENKFSSVIRPGCSTAFQTTPQSAVLVCELRPEARNDTSLELLVQEMKVYSERTVEGLKLDDIVLVPKGSVLKTSSGKVKRNAMKQLWEMGNIARLVDSSGSLQNGNLRHVKSLEELFRLVGVEDFNLTLVENGVDSMRLVQIVEVARENFGVQIEYAQASSLSVAELTAKATTKRCGTILQVPLEQPFTYECAKRVLPSVSIRMARQALVLIVVGVAILCSIVPSATYIRKNAVYDSEWWVHNYRAGPLVALVFPIWMLSYSAVCIIMKWAVLGVQHPGEFLSLWSGRFSRYWTVVRLVQVWEATVGLVVADTPLKNIFYRLLGARISLTARLHVPIRCWDLVDIGPRSEIKGNIFPRRMHFSGVYFDSVTIGGDCIIGSGSVIMEGTTIKDTVRVANRTVVPPGSTLEATHGTWGGVPCSFQADEGADGGFSPVPLCTPFWTFCRGCFPPFFIAAMICAAWIANEMVYLPPEPSLGFYGANLKAYDPFLYGLAIYVEHWNARAFALTVSYLLAHQCAGLIMLFGCASIKWTFVCPFVVDRAEPLILLFYFPYLVKTIFYQWYHQLFGFKVGRGARIVSNQMVVTASTAHRVQLGRNSTLFTMTCSPLPAPKGVASSVWEWAASRFQLASPWSSFLAMPDITIGDNCECAVGSYLESGVTLEHYSGTSTMSRVAKDTTIKNRHRAIGNPADLVLPSKDHAERDEKPTLSKVAAECLRQTLLFLHVGWLFITAVVILEFLRDWSLPGTWDLELILPVKTAVGYLFAVLSLVIEIMLLKKVLFGRTRSASTVVQSYQGAVFHHLQVVGELIELMIYPLLGGLFPLPAYFKMLGASVDVTSVFINSNGYIDPGDADNTAVRSYAMMDEGSYCVCHRVDQGMLHQGRVQLNSGAVLHPGSGLMLGSLGKGSQLFPLSKALREMHTGDEQIWIGLPAGLARRSGDETPPQSLCATEVVDI